MIGTISIKVNAAKPNFPLQPMFAFMGSPSSIRVLDVPKSIGNWEITSVRVAATYPDNTTVEKTAVRNGSVWVATVEGCEVAGKVLNGYSVLADGKDEDGNEVSGYVLGKGDVFILENDTELSRLVGKIAVRYVDDIPDVPTKGDLMNSNGELRLFDGNDWILISTGEHSAVYDSQITIQKNGTSVGSFTTNSENPVSIDIPVPSRTSDIENDVGYITANALPTKVSELENDVGYLTASSSAFTAKRDKTDMEAVVGTTYASWNLSALHSATYSPALELKWGTYNVFGQEQGCWLVDDEYRQLCFFLMPELNMLYWGVRNQDGSYIAGYGETITLSSDELSIATINGVAEITCTRTSKEGSPEVSTIATMKDLRGFQNINEKRDWWDNTTPASVDATGKFTINTFSVMVGSSSYVLDQFSKSGSTSTWKTTSGDYPNITTTDGLNFILNYDSSTTAYFTMGQLKPGPAKGTIGGSNFNVYANFKLTTFALKDYVDGKFSTKRDLTDISYSGKDEDAFFLGVGSFTIELPDTWTVTEQKIYVLDSRQKNQNYYKLWNTSPAMFYINTLNDAAFNIMNVSGTWIGSFTWNQVKGGDKVKVTIIYQGVQYPCHVQANWETTNFATANDVVKMSKNNTLLQGENIRINTNGQSDIGLLVANQYHNGYALTQSGIAKYNSNAATKAFNFPSDDATGSTFATREWVQSQGYSSGSVDDYVPVTIQQNLGSDSTNYQLSIYNHRTDSYMSYETNNNQMGSGYSTMNFMVFNPGLTLKECIDNNDVLSNNNWYVEYSDYYGTFYRSSWDNVKDNYFYNFMYVKVVKD